MPLSRHIRSAAYGGLRSLDRIRLALIARRLRRFFQAKVSNDLLEIGSADGALLAKFKAMGHRVHGVDPGMLHLADHSDSSIVEAISSTTAESIRLCPDSFDLVVSIHTIEHLGEPASVFRKCRAALRKNGVVYFVTPNGASSGVSIFGERWWFFEDPTHIRFFTPQSITLMLESAGFHQIKVRPLILDSFLVEASSVTRYVLKGDSERGILGTGIGMLLCLLVAPLAFAARILYPPLIPSMEIVAVPRK